MGKDHGFLKVSQNFTWGDNIKKRVGAENKIFNEFKTPTNEKKIYFFANSYKLQIHLSSSKMRSLNSSAMRVNTRLIVKRTVQVISAVKYATLYFALKADNSLPRAHNHQYGKTLVRINDSMEGRPLCVRAYRVPGPAG